MKLKFRSYLAKLSTSFVFAAREATKASLKAAEHAAFLLFRDFIRDLGSR